jgi:hypothetical protein
MNSETITDQGDAVAVRQGSSRAWASYHSRIGACSSLIGVILTREGGPASRGADAPASRARTRSHLRAPPVWQHVASGFPR